MIYPNYANRKCIDRSVDSGFGRQSFNPGPSQVTTSVSGHFTKSVLFWNYFKYLSYVSKSQYIYVLYMYKKNKLAYKNYTEVKNMVNECSDVV